MASIISKKVNGSTYYYLREMARVGGKPKMVSERYLGKAADIEAAIAGVRRSPSAPGTSASATSRPRCRCWGGSG